MISLVVLAGCGAGWQWEQPEGTPLSSTAPPPPELTTREGAMASAAAAARQPARFVPAPPLPAGPAEVEGVNAQGAWLLPLDGSAGVMVYRWQLPPEVKDGDVVLDGRVDRQATERHHAWISQQLADLERRERRLDVTGSGGPALTPR